MRLIDLEWQCPSSIPQWDYAEVELPEGGKLQIFRLNDFGVKDGIKTGPYQYRWERGGKVRHTPYEGKDGRMDKFMMQCILNHCLQGGEP